MRATQLEDCENLYLESIERLKVGRVNMKRKGNLIKEMKSTVNKWAQKFEAYKAMDGRRSNMNDMEIELACAEINECFDLCR